MAGSKDFVIEQGKTFQHVLRWETRPVVYAAISGVTQTAPVRITTAAPHNIPDGWRATVVSVKGMTQLNAQNTPPKNADYKRVTVVDATHIEFNDVNAADYKAYVSGGYLQFMTPVALTSFTARMSIKDKVGGTELLRLDTTNSRITIDTAGYTISLTIDATTTAGLAWTKGVYDLEVVSGSGVVTALLSGTITVSKEVTTT